MSPQDLGLKDGCSNYISGLGYAAPGAESAQLAAQYALPPAAVAAYKEHLEQQKNAAAAADRAMQELLAGARPATRQSVAGVTLGALLPARACLPLHAAAPTSSTADTVHPTSQVLPADTKTMRSAKSTLRASGLLARVLRTKHPLPLQEASSERGHERSLPSQNQTADVHAAAVQRRRQQSGRSASPRATRRLPRRRARRRARLRRSGPPRLGPSQTPRMTRRPALRRGARMGRRRAQATPRGVPCCPRARRRSR